jgi:hypothetical protein
MGQGDPDIQINIKTTGASQAQKDIDNVKKSLTSVYKEAGGGLNGLRAAGKQVADSYKEAGGGIKGVITALGGAGPAAAAAGGLAAALGLAAKALHEFAGAQSRVFAMDAALAQHGELTEKVREKLQNLAGTMEDLTGVADDEWYAAITRLISFGAKPEEIDKHIKAVEDLAGIYNGDVRQAAEAASKALGGNFEQFQRLGVLIPQVGSNGQKLVAVYRQLSEIGGGQLKAQNEGLEGSLKKLYNEFNNLLEAGGKLAVRLGLVEKIQVLTTAADYWANAFGGVIEKSKSLNNVLQRTKPSVEDSAKATKAYADELAKVEKLSDDITASLNHQAEAQRKLTEHQNKMIDARLQTEIAKVNADVKAGVISPKTGEMRKAALTERADSQKFENEKALNAKERELAEEEVRNRQARIRVAEDAVNKARAEDIDQQALDKEFTERFKPRKKSILSMEETIRENGETPALKSALGRMRDDLENDVAEFNKQYPRRSDTGQNLLAAQANLTRVREENAPVIEAARQRVGDLGDDRREAAELHAEQKRASLVRDYSEAGVHYSQLGPELSKSTASVDQFTGKAIGVIQRQSSVMERAADTIENQNRRLDALERRFDVLSQQSANLRNR